MTINRWAWRQPSLWECVTAQWFSFFISKIERDLRFLPKRRIQINLYLFWMVAEHFIENKLFFVKKKDRMKKIMLAWVTINNVNKNHCRRKSKVFKARIYRFRVNRPLRKYERRLSSMGIFILMKYYITSLYFIYT